MSNTVRPHRWQPTRLRRPWDSPGKNTGVGCHFLLQCVKVKSLSHVRLFVTPWTAVYQAPPSMGFSKQEYCSGLPLPSPKFILDSFNYYLITLYFSWGCCCSVTLVQLFPMPWTTAHQASLSFIISQSLLRLMSCKSMMPSSHLILCRPLLLLPSIFPSIRVFSNELTLCIK